MSERQVKSNRQSGLGFVSNEIGQGKNSFLPDGVYHAFNLVGTSNSKSLRIFTAQRSPHGDYQERSM